MPAKTPELLPLGEKSRFPTNRPLGQKPAPGARLGFRGYVLWGAASPWLFADGEEGSETNVPQELVRAQPACQPFLLQPWESSDDWERMGLKHLHGGRLLEAHLNPGIGFQEPTRACPNLGTRLWVAKCLFFSSQDLRPGTGFPGGVIVKNPPADAGDTGLIPGSGRGNGNPLPTFFPRKSHG